jgi:hypothetical protein
MTCENHICKTCKYQRRIKCLDTCSDCSHNDIIKPLSGIGTCCWKEKQRDVYWDDTSGEITL